MHANETSFSNVVSSLACAALLAATVVGCQAGTDEDAKFADASLAVAQVAEADPAPIIPAALGVIANGTGCPAGTWSATVSDDGQRARVTFREFFAEVGGRDGLEIKDCVISVTAPARADTAYGIAAVYVHADAYLGAEVSARWSRELWDQGTPGTRSFQDGGSLSGPYEGSADQQVQLGADAIGTPWTPCGVERALNALTRVRLVNTQPPRAGYVDIDSIEVQLISRACKQDPRK